jgi:hypothetical protein
MLEALDGLDASLQLPVERLGHVVGSGQPMHAVVTHEVEPMPFQERDDLPLPRPLARAPTSETG